MFPSRSWISSSDVQFRAAEWSRLDLPCKGVWRIITETGSAWDCANQGLFWVFFSPVTPVLSNIRCKHVLMFLDKASSMSPAVNAYRHLQCLQDKKPGQEAHFWGAVGLRTWGRYQLPKDTADIEAGEIIHALSGEIREILSCKDDSIA